MGSVVYALLDPRSNEPRYVGVTQSGPVHRLQQHVSAARSQSRKRKLPVAYWVEKLLDSGVRPHMVILSKEPHPSGDAYSEEVELISRFKSYGHRLLNVTEGGAGGGLGPKSEEHRAKISAALKGKKKPPRTDEWRSAHSAKMIGRKHSPETRAKLSEAGALRREMVAVEKSCACGAVFRVSPSRVDRVARCRSCIEARRKRSA